MWLGFASRGSVVWQQSLLRFAEKWHLAWQQKGRSAVELSPPEWWVDFSGEGTFRESQTGVKLITKCVYKFSFLLYAHQVAKFTLVIFLLCHKKWPDHLCVCYNTNILCCVWFKINYVKTFIFSKYQIYFWNFVLDKDILIESF